MKPNYESKFSKSFIELQLNRQKEYDMEKKISMFTPTREDPKTTENKICTPT